MTDQPVEVGAGQALAQRLGYPEDSKLVILNCDDLGSSHAANVGIYEALRDGAATSATLMVPCPWARGAAAIYRGEDIGVHLTLNCENDRYRWGPITHAPSLLDGDGGFPRTLPDLWEHADVDEVRRELRAQIERAILWGFDVTHLDSHMGPLQLKAELFDVYLEMAAEFQVPLRLSGTATQGLVGFPFRDLAAEAGVLAPDHLVVLFLHGGVGSRETALAAIENLQPGVTELYFHPAIDTPELRAISEDWPQRVDDHALLVHDGGLRAVLESCGATSISYRALRDLMRAGDRAISRSAS